MSKRIFVAGHLGMVGSAICRRLTNNSDTADIVTAGRKMLDLTDPVAVRSFFQNNSIDEIYLAAAKVGGIHANNTQRVEFLHENLAIQLSVLRAAHEADIGRLLFLGSSCIYPRLTQQPIKEEQLLTGSLEPTNESYAIAKIAGLKLCESYNREFDRDFRALMPTNLYGPGDNFSPSDAHVIPALISRFHDAKVNKSEVVSIWGSGTPKREFMHVDDLADASIFAMSLEKDALFDDLPVDNQFMNVGTGIEHSIGSMARLVADVVGYEGALDFDHSKADGTPRKLLDTSRLNSHGWKYSIDLEAGLHSTYEWFLKNSHRLRK